MLELFLVGAALTVLVQPNTGRTMAAGIFVGGMCVSALASPYLSAPEVYVVRGLADALAVFLLAGIRPIPRLVVLLHQIAAVSFILNAVGLALYWYYVDAVFYNAAYILLSLWALYVLLKKDRAEDGHYHRRGAASGFRFTFRPDLLDDKEH